MSAKHHERTGPLKSTIDIFLNSKYICGRGLPQGWRITDIWYNSIGYIRERLFPFSIHGWTRYSNIANEERYHVYESSCTEVNLAQT